MSGAASPPVPRRRLFWYVYLHGLAILFVVLVVVVALMRLVGRVLPFSTYAEDVAHSLSARGAAAFEDPSALQTELDRERRRTGTDMTVRRVDGTVVASNVTPPLPALEATQVPRLRRGPVPWPWLQANGRPRLRYNLHVPLPGKDDPLGYVTITVPLALPIVERLTVIILGILGVIAVVSIPLARRIVRPMERLTTTARALGAGDLSVRSGIVRTDEVGQLASSFDEMAERLQRLVKGQKELLANVSHELRTPLSRIGVALDLAAENDAAKLRGYLEEIRSDVTELERLVEDVLSAARLDVAVGASGLPPLRLERIGAGELVQRAAEHFRDAHPDRALEVKAADGLPPLNADAVLLRRALDNVLENARKYSDVEQPIALSAAAENGHVTIDVEDRGIGIDAEDLPRLFTPFFRTDRSRARGTGGVGLGLALTKRIVEAHGGSVRVESSPGVRTSVRFVLPAA